jgi:hypothetical protein
MLLIGFSVLVVAARGLARYTLPPLPSGPFVTFADVLPGQPGSTLEEKGFLCASMRDYDDPTHENCIMKLDTGAISEVNVYISLAIGIIQRVTFTMRENSIKAGDLMTIWGQPEIQRYSRSTYLFWRGRGVHTIVSCPTGRFSLLYYVSNVSFNL